MRIVLCGQRSFGAAALKLLVDRGDDVALVVAPPWRDTDLPEWADDPGEPDRLTEAARLIGKPWRPSATFTAEQMPEGVDLIVCAHAHNFVSARARGLALLGGIGYHPSLLPRHRGRDAVRWTVHMRDPIGGGSVYWLTNAVDGGPIAAQDWCFVQPQWTARDLWRIRLMPMGVRLLGETLTDLDAGRVMRTAQDEVNATWEPSWSRPPLHRPDLLAIGPSANGYRTVEGVPR